MELKVCVVGCGALGGQHAKAWTARSGATVAAVADPNQERAAALAATLGAKPYTDYKDAVMCDGVNVVSVCTPTCFHPDISCFAMQNGRHVLCEKPIALTLKEADRMIRTSKTHGVHLAISLQIRGHSPILKYKEIYESGAMGSPIHGLFSGVAEVRPKTEMNRKSFNGGPLVDLTCHRVDAMRFITGAEPVSVYALGHVFGKGKKRTAPFEHDLAIDAASMLVHYTGGHMLSYYVNWGMPEGFKGFSGQEAILGPNLYLRPTSEGVEAVGGDGVKTLHRKQGPDPAGPTVRVNDLVDAITKGTPLQVTGEDGRIALAVSLAALKSIETGRVVRL